MYKCEDYYNDQTKWVIVWENETLASVISVLFVQDPLAGYIDNSPCLLQ